MDSATRKTMDTFDRVKDYVMDKCHLLDVNLCKENCPYKNCPFVVRAHHVWETSLENVSIALPKEDNKHKNDKLLGSVLMCMKKTHVFSSCWCFGIFIKEKNVTVNMNDELEVCLVDKCPSPNEDMTMNITNENMMNLTLKYETWQIASNAGFSEGNALEEATFCPLECEHKLSSWSKGEQNGIV